MPRYIDAEKLIDDIRPFAEYDSNLSNKDWVRRFEIAIDDQPTADVRENVRDKWWHEPHTNNTWIQRCSNCFHVAMITVEEECPYNYCPLCGADMRGGQHEKDN